MHGFVVEPCIHVHTKPGTDDNQSRQSRHFLAGLHNQSNIPPAMAKTGGIMGYIGVFCFQNWRDTLLRMAGYIAMIRMNVTLPTVGAGGA